MFLRLAFTAVLAVLALACGESTSTTTTPSVSEVARAFGKDVGGSPHYGEIRAVRCLDGAIVDGFTITYARLRGRRTGSSRPRSRAAPATASGHSGEQSPPPPKGTADNRGATRCCPTSQQWPTTAPIAAVCPLGGETRTFACASVRECHPSGLAGLSEKLRV